MEDTLKKIIGKLEQSLLKSMEANSGMPFQAAFSYSFIDPGNTPDIQLKTLGDPLAGVNAVLQLICRYPDVHYFYDPDYLCRYLEHYTRKGYEELLMESVRHSPMAYTLHLLHRVINDTGNPCSQACRALLAKIAENTSYAPSIRQDAAERITHIHEQERPLAVSPSNYRIITLTEAIGRFDLETLFYRDGSWGELKDVCNVPPPVILFEGDTVFEDDLNISRIRHYLYQSDSPQPFTDFQKLCAGESSQESRIIIVNGNLSAKKLHMNGIDALFVFGNLHCDKFYFYEATMAYVEKDLHAEQAVLGSALSEDECFLEEKGAAAACVKGSIYAPRVQTWFMRLGHLNWAEGSGKEFAEDETLPHEKHLTDNIW